MQTYEADGKLLAIGLNWRRIITEKAVLKDIARKGAETRSSYYWYDSEIRTVGFTPREFKMGGQVVYPAMAAFLRLLRSEGVRYGILLFEVEQDEIIVLGVVDGQPYPEFDKVVTEDEVGEVFKRFREAAKPNEVRTYTNIGAYADLQPDFDWHRLGSDEYLTEADALQSLYAGRRKAILMTMTAMVVVAAAIGGLVVFRQYQAKKAAALQAERENPQRRYNESLAQLVPVTPVGMKAASELIKEFLSKIPINVGEWALTDIGECKLAEEIGGQSKCKLTYKRPMASKATNESFVKDSPKDWTPVFQEGGMQIQVMVPIKIKAKPLETIREKLPATFDTYVKTGSDLQRWSVMIDGAKLNMPTAWGAPDGLAVEALGVTGIIKRGEWAWSGPARSLELLTNMPDNFWVTTFQIGINQNGVTQGGGAKSSVYRLQKIEGYYYVRT